MPETGVVEEAAVSAATGASATSEGVAGESAAPAEVQPDTGAAVEGTTEAPTSPPSFDVAAGQPMPAEFRTLSQHADPAVAQLASKVQSLWDRTQAFMSHGTVADFKQFRELFPGGMEEAQRAAQRAAELDEVDADYSSRDSGRHAELARAWAENDPEAFSSLASQAMITLAERNPQAYQGLGLQILESTLGSLYQRALGSGNQDAASRIDLLMKDVFGRGVSERPRIDPREQQIEQRESALKQREQEYTGYVSRQFANDANNAAGSQVRGLIQTNLGTALAGFDISTAAKQRIEDEIYADLNSKLFQDKGLQARLQSIVQEGQRRGFSNQHHTQWVDALLARSKSMLPSSAQAIVNRWTQDFLRVRKAETAKIERAAAKKDVGGGASPNYAMPALNADQIAKMSNEELLAYNGPITPEARQAAIQKIRESKFGLPAA